MPRIGRIVIPGLPHHVTQRGNRRQRTFFREEDYRTYKGLLSTWCSRCGVEVWAYCLMPNHVHLIAVPSSEEALRRAMSQVHLRYTHLVNKRQGWKGYLWQGRFSSFIMDEDHMLKAARYVELNPVRAGLTHSPGVYPWSSAAAHLSGVDDGLVRVAPLLEATGGWEEFLSLPEDPGDIREMERHSRDGRPLGSEHFMTKLEKLLGIPLRPGKRGPKPRESPSS